MNKLLVTGIYLMLVCAFISCDNPDSMDCFKKTGTMTTKDLNVEPFHTVIVQDEVDLYLLNGNDRNVQIHAGYNLIDKIHCNISGDVLTITNDNTCNWIRKPGNPGIYIVNTDLKKIEIYDYVNIYTPDTLKLSHLQIFSNGPGVADLLLDVDSLIIESIFVTNFYARGKADYFRIYNINDSMIKARYLVSGRIYIEHFGSNVLELYPLEILKGKMTSSGNLIYYHEPDDLQVSVSGTGKLIDNSE